MYPGITEIVTEIGYGTVATIHDNNVVIRVTDLDSTATGKVVSLVLFHRRGLARFDDSTTEMVWDDLPDTPPLPLPGDSVVYDVDSKYWTTRDQYFHTLTCVTSREYVVLNSSRDAVWHGLYSEVTDATITLKGTFPFGFPQSYSIETYAAPEDAWSRPREQEATYLMIKRGKTLSHK